MSPERESTEAVQEEEEQPSSGAGSGRGSFFKKLAKDDPQRMRVITSKGGLTSQGRGTAHQWTAEDGRAANARRRTRGHRGQRKS